MRRLYFTMLSLAVMAITTGLASADAAIEVKLAPKTLPEEVAARASGVFLRMTDRPKRVPAGVADDKGLLFGKHNGEILADRNRDGKITTADRPAVKGDEQFKVPVTIGGRRTEAVLAIRFVIEDKAVYITNLTALNGRLLDEDIWLLDADCSLAASKEPWKRPKVCCSRPAGPA